MKAAIPMVAVLSFSFFLIYFLCEYKENEREREREREKVFYLQVKV
jgi:hypothetical protein